MHRPDELDYLTFAADLSDQALVAVCDELPLWSAPFGAMLLRHIPLRRGATALDLGCGTGSPLLELAQRLGAASTVYGVDPWTATLERAREKATRWGVPNAGRAEPEHPDGLHRGHLQNDRIALSFARASAHRVCRTSG